MTWVTAPVAQHQISMQLLFHSLAVRLPSFTSRPGLPFSVSRSKCPGAATRTRSASASPGEEEASSEIYVHAYYYY
jgi:hypothetical protein